MLKFRFETFILLVCLFDLYNSLCTKCPDGWFRGGRNCFSKVGRSKSFDEGNSLCNSTYLGATLLDPHILLSTEFNKLTPFLVSINTTVSKQFFPVNAYLLNSTNGSDTNAIFQWKSDKNQFNCTSSIFCGSACNQNATDRPAVFLRVNASYTCYTNSPDKEFFNDVVCQFRLYQ